MQTNEYFPDVDNSWVTRLSERLSETYDALSNSDNEDAIEAGTILNEIVSSGQAIIIAGFPGVGKKSLESRYPDERILRITSDEMQHDTAELVKTILANRMTANVILVDSFPEVQRILKKNNLAHILVYPSEECLTEYAQRYSNRGDSDYDIEYMHINWSIMLQECRTASCCHKIELPSMYFLEDIVTL